MILNWKEFHIDLNLFKEFLEANIPEADGIVASPAEFMIVEKQDFTPEQILLIMDYYNNLLSLEVENG